MALEAMDPRDFKYFTHEDRRPSGGYPTTLAMHWDGTYRDRLRPVEEPALYWTEDEYLLGIVADPNVIAKHLA